MHRLSSLPTKVHARPLHPDDIVERDSYLLQFFFVDLHTSLRFLRFRCFILPWEAVLLFSRALHTWLQNTMLWKRWDCLIFRLHYSQAHLQALQAEFGGNSSGVWNGIVDEYHISIHAKLNKTDAKIWGAGVKRHQIMLLSVAARS